MGLIQSMLVTVSLCAERLLTWTCCACAVVAVLSAMIMFMVYGITLGYHHAQKELVAYAEKVRTTPLPKKIHKTNWWQRSGDEIENEPAERLEPDIDNQLEDQQIITDSILETYETKPTTVDYREAVRTANLMESDRATMDELTPHERELARKLINRIRRSKNNNTISNTLKTTSEISTYSPTLVIT